MLEFDILDDENLTEVLNTLISGMLPHEGFDPTMYGTIYRNIVSYIRLEEMKMQYFALLSALDAFNKMQAAMPEFKPMLTREVFESTLRVSIFDLVRTPEVGMSSYLQREGKNNDLRIETVQQEAAEILYQLSLDLYDECYALATPSSEALNVMPVYKLATLSNVASTSMNVQRAILQEEKRIGRKRFSGVNDWFEYIRLLNIEIERRLNTDTENIIHLNDLEVANRMFANLAALYESLALYEIPQLDDETSMLKHRLVVRVGLEGVGKTTAIIDDIGKLLMAGRRVVVMSGETPPEQMVSMILVNYIYHKTGKWVTRKHVAGVEECPPEIQQLIAICRLELFESGRVIVVKTFNYRTLSQELKDLYEQYKFDALFIDHSRALSGGPGDKDDITMLSKDLREFKRNYPVYCCVVSHPSVKATEFLQKDKPVGAVSPTAGSSDLSREADEVFIHLSTPEYKKQSLFGQQIWKRRGPALSRVVVLKMMPDIYHYEYDPAYQNLGDVVNVEAQSKLNEIAARYGEDSDEFEFYDDGEEDDELVEIID